MIGMKSISEKIVYLPSTCDPLSAEVVKISGETKTWFYDVGSCEKARQLIENTQGQKGIVISHFHPDHMRNLDALQNVDTKAFSDVDLFVGENTFKYTKRGTIVCGDIFIEDGVSLHIFPIPSCHAKGSLGLEINEEYAFLGDALYSTYKKENPVYNVQMLKEEIEVLKSLQAGIFLLSHQMDKLQSKGEVIANLEEIYGRRQKNNPFIPL